jgi:hypothetical protein
VPKQHFLSIFWKIGRQMSTIGFRRALILAYFTLASTASSTVIFRSHRGTHRFERSDLGGSVTSFLTIAYITGCRGASEMGMTAKAVAAVKSATIRRRKSLSRMKIRQFLNPMTWRPTTAAL